MIDVVLTVEVLGQFDTGSASALRGPIETPWAFHELLLLRTAHLIYLTPAIGST